MEIEKLEELKLALWIHPPALHFGATPLFSRSHAAVHEVPYTYTQLITKVIPMQLAETHFCTEMKNRKIPTNEKLQFPVHLWKL